MKLIRIGEHSSFENLTRKTINRPDTNLVITKPSIGIWFCIDNSWSIKLNTDWHERLVGKKTQEFEFDGILLDEDQITPELIRTIKTPYNGELVALDFDKIRNLGYDGVICRNPSKRIFKDWDVPSIVIWSAMDKLAIINEVDIPYPPEHAIDQLRREFFNITSEMDSCEYDHELYSQYDDHFNTIIKKTIPERLSKFPEYQNALILFKYLEKNKNIDSELVKIDFKYDNYTMIKYEINKNEELIIYSFSISLIVENNCIELFKNSRSIQIDQLNKDTINQELDYIAKIFSEDVL